MHWDTIFSLCDWLKIENNAVIVAVGKVDTHTRSASTLQMALTLDSSLAIYSQSPKTVHPLKVTNNTSGTLSSKIGEQVHKDAQINLFYNEKLEIFCTPTSRALVQ